MNGISVKMFFKNQHFDVVMNKDQFKTCDYYHFWELPDRFIITILADSPTMSIITNPVMTCVHGLFEIAGKLY